MPTFVVESYATESVVDAQRQRAQQAGRLGPSVRYVRTTYLPTDETLLHVFEAASAETLGEALQDAALTYDRITDAIEPASSEVNVEAAVERQ
jgi:hypothetical protein